MDSPVKTLVVTKYTDILDPGTAFLGPVHSGDQIKAVLPPGCWGPMLTPELRSGHEVSWPVAIADAEPGDSLCIAIEKIDILSRAATSGVHSVQRDHVYGNDPYVGKRCPGCGLVNPPSKVVGDGPGSIRCQKCGSIVQSCGMVGRYTMLFDAVKTLGITVNEALAGQIRQNAREYSALPRNSRQHPANLLAGGDLPGIIARVKPLVGNIGTMPGCAVPSSHNSRDVAGRLVGDAHLCGLSEKDLASLTDGHLDDNLVVEKAMLICPVMVSGGGVYLGDVHAMQSSGEIAGHATDVSAVVTVRVELLKGTVLPGPLLLPPPELLPDLLKPLEEEERRSARLLAEELGITLEEPGVPLLAIGTGPDLNRAVSCGLERLSRIMEMDMAEVRNRVTITGHIGIGRLPGTVHLGFLTPPKRIPDTGLQRVLVRRYGLKKQ